MPAEDARYLVRADGASRGNPGPAAIGVIVTDSSGNVVRRLGRRIGRATNNEAEYRALIAGLEAALALGAKAVEVRLDAELAVRQVRGHYGVRSPHLRPLFDRVLGLARRFSSFVIVAVPRTQNREADVLANAALDGAEIDFSRAPC